MLGGRGLCNGPITRPEGSYRVWCVSVIEEIHRGGLGPLGLSSHEKKKALKIKLQLITVLTFIAAVP
jgi:hypothetical protein